MKVPILIGSLNPYQVHSNPRIFPSHGLLANDNRQLVIVLHHLPHVQVGFGYDYRRMRWFSEK